MIYSPIEEGKYDSGCITRNDVVVEYIDELRSIRRQVVDDIKLIFLFVGVCGNDSTQPSSKVHHVKLIYGSRSPSKAYALIRIAFTTG